MNQNDLIFAGWVVGLTGVVLLIQWFVQGRVGGGIKRLKGADSRRGFSRALPVLVMIVGVALVALIGSLEDPSVRGLGDRAARNMIDQEFVMVRGIANDEHVLNHFSAREDQGGGFPDLNVAGGCLRVVSVQGATEWTVDSDESTAHYEEVAQASLGMHVEVDRDRVDPRTGGCSDAHRAKIQVEIGRFERGRTPRARIFVDGKPLEEGGGDASWTLTKTEPIAGTDWVVQIYEIRPVLLKAGERAEITMEYSHRRSPTQRAMLYPNPRDFGELTLEKAEYEIRWPYPTGPDACYEEYRPDPAAREALLKALQEKDFGAVSNDAASYFRVRDKGCEPPEGVRHSFQDDTFRLIVDRFEEKAFLATYGVLREYGSEEHVRALAAHIRSQVRPTRRAG